MGSAQLARPWCEWTNRAKFKVNAKAEAKVNAHMMRVTSQGSRIRGRPRSAAALDRQLPRKDREEHQPRLVLLRVDGHDLHCFREQGRPCQSGLDKEVS